MGSRWEAVRGKMSAVRVVPMMMSGNGHKPRVEDDGEAENVDKIAFRMGLISPNRKEKEQWDWFVLLLVFYTGITVPFCLAFTPFTDFEVSKFGWAIDTLVDLCYIADVFVSWRTTYYDREGVLVLDKKLARQRYVKTWFPLDIIASFPYEYFLELCTIGTNMTIPPSLRLPSILKLMRIVRLGKKIDRLSSSKMFRIGQFTFMLLFAAHWYACIWFYVGTLAEPATGQPIVFLPGHEGTSWVYRKELQTEDVAMQYTAALYWAVTTLMKSPWFHPSSPMEFISALLMIICGCVLFAYFIGNVTAVITAANAAGGRYRAMMGELKSFCKNNNLSPKLTHKLVVYQDAQWQETDGGVNKADMIARYVPTHLLPHVIVEMYKPMMINMPFLLDCSGSATVGFLRSLKLCVCDRGDVLLQAGAFRRTMYILNKGEVKIDYDDKAAKETLEMYSSDLRIGGPKKGKGLKRSAKDSLRGRTDKMGTMLGFADVFKKIEPLEYSVTATKRVIAYAITRAQLKDLLSIYVEDREIFETAINKANAQIKNSSSNSLVRRSSEKINSKDADGASHAGAVTRTPHTSNFVRRGSTLAQIEAESERKEQAAKEARALRETTREASRALQEASVDGSSRPTTPSAKPGAVVEGVASDEIDSMRRQLDTLTNIVKEQFKMMEQQSMMIDRLVQGQDHVETLLVHPNDEDPDLKKEQRKKRQSITDPDRGSGDRATGDNEAGKVAMLMG